MFRSLLFLHKLQGADCLLGLYCDEVHTVVQAFQVQVGEALGLAVMHFLAETVINHNLAAFFGQANGELSHVRVGIDVHVAY